jgi:ectoine hydroxylase-related dioxygenase (phytanoyl-CoA dioxygenase family)
MTQPTERNPSESRVAQALADLEKNGYAVLEELLDANLLNTARAALRNAARQIRAEIGEPVLIRRGDMEMLRLPMKYDSSFFTFLEIPEILAVVDAYLTPQAVLRFQSGVLSGPDERDAPPPDNRAYHQNFPFIRGTTPIALDMAFLLTPMTGTLMVVPGSHTVPGRPPEENLHRTEVPLHAPAGSALLLDGHLWHRGTEIAAGDEQWMVVQQFTHPIIKQHFDFPRALGESTMRALPERVRRILGWEVRVPTNLSEFYLPEEERLFRNLTETVNARYRREERAKRKN